MTEFEAPRPAAKIFAARGVFRFTRTFQSSRLPFSPLPLSVFICVYLRAAVKLLLHLLCFLHFLLYPHRMRSRSPPRKLPTETQLYMSAQRALMRRAHSISRNEKISRSAAPKIKTSSPP